MSSQERLKILQMVEDQVITPEDGLSLLEMVAQVRNGVDSAEPQRSTNQPRQLRICVTNTKTNQSSVNVNVPLGLVEVSYRMGARFVPGMSEDAYGDLIRAAKLAPAGKLYDALSADGEERIELIVE